MTLCLAAREADAQQQWLTILPTGSCKAAGAAATNVAVADDWQPQHMLATTQLWRGAATSGAAHAPNHLTTEACSGCLLTWQQQQE